MDIPHPIVAFLQVGMLCRAWSLFRAAVDRPSCRFVALIFQAIRVLLTMGLMAWSVYDEGHLGPTREP